jgi:hypothetical protein
MTFDSQRQKELILQIIDSVNFPGKALEEAHALKQAVKAAKIAERTHARP